MSFQFCLANCLTSWISDISCTSNYKRNIMSLYTWMYFGSKFIHKVYLRRFGLLSILWDNLNIAIIWYFGQPIRNVKSVLRINNWPNVDNKSSERVYIDKTKNKLTWAKILSTFSAILFASFIIGIPNNNKFVVEAFLN